MRKFELCGAPFDGAATLGWPGSRYAPDRVRRSLSWMLQRRENDRVYCLDDGVEHDFPEDLLIDRGDASTVAHDLEASLDAARGAVRDSAITGRVPLLLGGDDCLLYAGVAGIADATAGQVAIIHFDAHLDLLDSNEQQGRWSHSSGMRRALEIENVDPERSLQVGSRHFNFPSSLAARERLGLANIPAAKMHRDGIEATLKEVRARIRGADKVVFAFDIDTIDPAHAPGAGAHEPGGLTSWQALEAVRGLAAHTDAMVLTEVNPLTDVGDRTSNLAAYLLVHFAVHGAARRSG